MKRALIGFVIAGFSLAMFACGSGVDGEIYNATLDGPPPPSPIGNAPNADTTPSTNQQLPAATQAGSAFLAPITGSAWLGYGSNTSNTSTSTSSGNGGDTDAGN